VITKVGAAVLAAIILIPLLFAAGVSGTISAVFGGTNQPSATALADIPANYLALYREAAGVCPGLDWTILAAIGKIESNHGRSPLPGVSSGENDAGAAGPMQFLQPSWNGILARHQLPSGGAMPPSRYNPHNAIHAAAFYLCDSGARDGRDLRAAIFAYNHATWYVDKVLDQAEKYRAAATAEPPGRRTTWPPERATVPDPTSGGQITRRTLALVHALRVAGMSGNGIGCFAQRPANPSSDHPQGRACDVMFNPHNPASVADGWQVANWLTTNQAALGVKYLIWQGQYWSADKPSWATYISSAYGCPNAANVTGCHYDHIHISIY
jgi:hypothetical protein